MMGAVGHGPALTAIIGANTAPFKQGLGEVRGLMPGFASDLKKWGAIAAAGLAAIVAPLALAARSGMSFERQMSRVKAIVNPTAKEFAELNSVARLLGETTEKTASEVAGAVQSLGQAGFKTQQIKDTLAAVVDMSTITGVDMASSATMVTDTLNQFALSTKRANDVASVFAYTQSNTNTNAMQLAEALKYVGKQANTVGWSVEETSAALGVLADNSFKGSTGGMSLNMALMQMLKPTEQAAKMIDRYGLGLRKTNGEFKSMADWLGDIEKANLMPEQLAEMFGVRGVRAIQALTGAQKEMNGEMVRGADILRKLTKGIEENRDYGQKAAETIRGDTTGAFERLFSILEGIGLTLFDKMAPGLKNLVDGVLVPGLQKINEWVRGSVGLANAFDVAFQYMGDLTTEAGLMAAAVAPAFETLLNIGADRDFDFLVAVQSVRKELEAIGPKLPGYIQEAREWAADLSDQVFDGLGYINDATVAWQDTGAAVRDMVVWTRDGLKVVRDILQVSGEGYGYLAEIAGEIDAAYEVTTAMGEAWDELWDAILGASEVDIDFNGMFDALLSAGKYVVEFWSDAYDTAVVMGENTKEFWVGVVNSITGGNQDFDGMFDSLYDGTVKGGEYVLNWWSTLFTDIDKGFRAVEKYDWSALFDVSMVKLDELVNFLSIKVPEAAGKGIAFLDATFTEFVARATVLADKLGSTIRRAFTLATGPEQLNLSKPLEAAITGVRKIGIEDAKAGAAAVGLSWMSGFVGALDGDGKQLLVESLLGIGEFVLGESPPAEGPLSAIDAGGRNIGAAFMIGLADGIQGNTGALTSALGMVAGVMGQTMSGVTGGGGAGLTASGDLGQLLGGAPGAPGAPGTTATGALGTRGMVNEDGLADYPETEEDSATRIQNLLDYFQRKNETVAAGEGMIAETKKAIEEVSQRQAEQNRKAAKALYLKKLKDQAEYSNMALTITGAFLGEQHAVTKAFGIANAVINTHEGVTNALSSYDPPKSWMMALQTLAMGYQQIRAIKGGGSPTPSLGAIGVSGAEASESGGGGGMDDDGGDIPMARGGLVTRPTRALIGEAGPEVVAPLDRVEAMVANSAAATMAALTAASTSHRFAGGSSGGGETVIRLEFVADPALVPKGRISDEYVKLMADAITRYVETQDGRLLASEARTARRQTPRRA